MACAGDMKWSIQAELESFYFSNMSPQRPGFNRGIWKVLEGVVRGFAYSEGSVFVITGPVLSDSRIAAPDTPGGRKRIPIPEWFYKVVYDETEPKKMIGFLIPHKEGLQGVRNYACTVADVEKRTGLSFFSSIKPEELGDMKKSFDIKQWSWMVK